MKTDITPFKYGVNKRALMTVWRRSTCHQYLKHLVALSTSFEPLRQGLHIWTTWMEWLREILTSGKIGWQGGGVDVGEGVGGSLSRESQRPVRDENHTKTRRLFMNGHGKGNVDWVFKQRIISHSRRKDTFWGGLSTSVIKRQTRKGHDLWDRTTLLFGEQVGSLRNKLQYVTTGSFQLAR